MGILITDQLTQLSTESEVLNEVAKNPGIIRKYLQDLTPPAKLERLPCSASPMVSPADPSTAITELVVTPNCPRIIIASTK